MIFYRFLNQFGYEVFLGLFGLLSSFFYTPVAVILLSALLLRVSQRFSRKKMALFLFASYSAFILWDFSWLATTTYHGNYVIFVWIFLSVLFAAPIYIWAFFYAKAEKSVYSVFFFSIVIVMMEWLRLYFLSGYSFASLGMFLDHVKGVSQVVYFLGMYGLTWVFAHAVLTMDFLIQKRELNKGFYLSLPVLLLFLYQPNLNEIGKIKVQIIQPGLKVPEKTLMYPYMDQFIPVKKQLQILLRKIKWGYHEKPELIILPEGLLPGLLEQPFIYANDLRLIIEEFFPKQIEISTLPSILSQKQAMKLIVDTLQIPVIYGALRMEENGDCYNSLILQDVDEAFQFYDKRILVPMGEYLPFEFLTNLAMRYGVYGFFSKGREKLLVLEDKKIIPSICYEDCFPKLGINKPPQNSSFIVNITNDGWFYPSRLPEVHARLSRLRAMELGLFLFRSCEQSMSGWIDPTGQEKLFDQNIHDIPVQNLKLSYHRTVYSLIGNKWILVSLTLLVFGRLIINFAPPWIRLALKRTVN